MVNEEDSEALDQASPEKPGTQVMQIGVTEVGEYKRCRERWDFGSSNRQNLEKLVPHSTALPIGTIVHASLSQWLEHPELSLAEIYQAEATLENAKIVERFKKALGYAPASGELNKLHEEMAMGMCMMDNYQHYWGSPLPPGFELVSPEQEISVPIPNTEHNKEWVYIRAEPHKTAQECIGSYFLARGETDEVEILSVETRYAEPTNVVLGWLVHVHYSRPRPHYQRGRLDAVIRNKAGVVFVLEHKTYGRRPHESTLRSNDQFLRYHWMLVQLVKQLELGKVGGVAYDGMWKRAAPPKDKTIHDLFFRLPIERPPAELEQFERMLAIEALEMGDNPGIYLNRTWDGSCDWGCQFNELCLATSRGEDVDYIRRTMYTQKQQPNEVKERDV